MPPELHIPMSLAVCASFPVTCCAYATRVLAADDITSRLAGAFLYAELKLLDLFEKYSLNVEVVGASGPFQGTNVRPVRGKALRRSYQSHTAPASGPTAFRESI